MHMSLYVIDAKTRHIIIGFGSRVVIPVVPMHLWHYVGPHPKLIQTMHVMCETEAGVSLKWGVELTATGKQLPFVENRMRKQMM